MARSNKSNFARFPFEQGQLKNCTYGFEGVHLEEEV